MNESRLADKWRPDHLGRLRSGCLRSGAHSERLAWVASAHRTPTPRLPRPITSLESARSATEKDVGADATAIYDTTTFALLQKPSRRFVSAENVFFARWWRKKPAEIKDSVRKLVLSGRLQFVGGGWTQNDEAVTHYTATIDQMTLGLRFLNSTFGPQCGVPSVAWQADPFGHSVTQAALFARHRSEKLELETAAVLDAGGGDGRILAWVPENTYTTPQAICFGWNDCLHPETEVYTNDTVAVMSGCDLCFSDANDRFLKQDDVLAMANRISAAQRKRRRVHVMHSTPACYVEASKQLSLYGEKMLQLESLNWFTVLVYNPASVPLSSHVRLPIGGTDEPTTSVVGPDGEKIESQVVQLAPHRHAIPEVLGNATSSLVFQVKVEPLGASLYHVKREPPAVQVPEDFLQVDEPANFIENERFRVVVNPETGLVSSVVLLGRQLTVQLRQTFGAYLFAVKAPGNMSPPGHYVFSAYREAEDMGDQVTYRIVKGPVVQEIHQIFNGFVSQIIAIHKDSPYIEFTWTVGPLTELVTFHKDKLPIPANYYPVTSWIYIEDKARDLQMLVVPDRPQGGTSLRKGHLELMVHRRHATNDELGNPEFLLETGNDDQALVAKGTHRLFLGSRAEVTSIMRLQALQLVYRPLLVFAPAGWRPRKKKFSALRQPLPSTVHVLTLEMLPAHEVLLRLEHLATNDTTVKISITRLLAGCRLENVRPTTLGANRFLPGPKRHRWRTQEEARGWKSRFSVDDVLMAAPEMTTESSTGDKHVNLRPGQIATFLAKLVAE
ncbi:hypothetical protein HPB49_005965 [Dermacentor silvarum]|uniref:Uncharacterized protein n=1 Tax=Dermacentor silvarum TaxID=543639 RepID=A0ACB8DND7_DERSI|nr:hypothetical protein HPB49_005965 [Dermacentor silvarum]